jgi:hypothetical protein
LLRFNILVVQACALQSLRRPGGLRHSGPVVVHAVPGSAFAWRDKVPDAKTIWLFRESVVRTGAIVNLFARFDKHFSRSGYLAKGGQILDTTIIQALKLRDSQEEKGGIKASDIPEAWQDKPAMLAQKDRDARWTVRYSKSKQPTETPTSAPTKTHDIAIPMFGFKKIHADIDRAHGFIRGWAVTSATAHDGASSAMSRPRTIPPQPFGPTAPIAPRPMRSGWQRTP